MGYRSGPSDPRVVASGFWTDPNQCAWRIVAPALSAFAEVLGLLRRWGGRWGKTVAFWQALGYQVEFETGRNSGRLEHPAGGPYLFIVERPGSQHPEIQPLVGTSDADSFEPPRAGTVEQPFTGMHWGAAQMLLRDPDGRHVSIQAPLPVADEPAPGS